MHPNWAENGGTDNGRDEFIEWDRTMVSWYPALGQRSGDTVTRSLNKLLVKDFITITSLKEGSVASWFPWMSIAEANYKDVIPEGLPYRTYTVVVDDSDPENPVTEERVHTWETWKGKNYTLDLIEGRYYYLCHAGNKGIALKDTELLIIHNAEGVQLEDTKPLIEEQDGE